MRILYVTADLPWPLTSGYLRHYHFIRALSERHQITLLSLYGPDHGAGDVAALEPYLEGLITERAARGRRSLPKKLADRARMVVAGGDEAAARLGAAAAPRARERPFDVLLLSGKRTMPVLSALPPIPLVADLCDATSSRILRQMRDATLPALPSLALEFLEVWRVERALMHRARHALFASARDRAAVVGPSGEGSGFGAALPTRALAPASVVPNGVDLAFWQRTGRHLGRDEIVLTGAMDYPPNVDAAVQLVEVLLPEVQRAVPSARVSIVGRDPTDRVRALADRPGVEVTGYVDDIRPYLERAAVFAAPIRHGAGIQNKLLEALAMELPVVASPLAAAGLRTEDGGEPPVDVATLQRMAEPIIARLAQAAAGVPPDPRLRSYVAQHFDWGRNAARLERILEDAADPASRVPESGA